MLGSQCSPCCGCTATALLELWQSLQTKTCSVSLSGNVPPQNAATSSMTPYACTDSVANSELVLQGIAPPNNSAGVYGPTRVAGMDATAAFWKQTESPVGTHTLLLNTAATSFSPSPPLGVITFSKTTEDYQITLTLNLLVNATANAIQLAGESCFLVPSCAITIYAPSASKPDGLFGLVPVTSRSLSFSQLFDPPSWSAFGLPPPNPQILRFNAPYWKLENSVVLSRYDANQWFARSFGNAFVYRFSGWWDESLKPSDIAWSANVAATLAGPLTVASDSTRFAAQFFGSASGSVQRSRWRSQGSYPFFLPNGSFVVGLDPGKLNLGGLGGTGGGLQFYGYLNDGGTWSPPGNIQWSSVAYTSAIEPASVSYNFSLS